MELSFASRWLTLPRVVDGVELIAMFTLDLDFFPVDIVEKTSPIGHVQACLEPALV